MQIGDFYGRGFGVPETTRGSDESGTWVRYEWPSGSRLLLTVGEGNVVRWEYKRLDARNDQQGAGVEWSHGHLVSVGDGGPQLFNLLSDLGLAFPSVDAELRAATGYEEPPA